MPNHLTPSQCAQCRRLHRRVGLTPEGIGRFLRFDVASVRKALEIRTNARRVVRTANSSERLQRARTQLLAMAPPGLAADKWREVVEANF